MSTEKLALHGGDPVRTAPFPTWPIYDQQEAEALQSVLTSGVWGVGGQKVVAFAQAFARYQNADHAVCVTNGTAALEIALRAAGVGLGDEVITTPYTFVATASACLSLGAIPLFADIHPDTYNLDPAGVEELISERTRAIVAVHIAGGPADMDAFPALAKKHGIPLIEDAAQAHSAAWRGQRVGAMGDLGTFSFQASKNLNAGEGGAIVSNNAELMDRCWSIHNCGRVRDGAWYQHEILGGNFRMTEWQAAILLTQIERLPAQCARRQENAAYLAAELTALGLHPLVRDARVTEHAYHLFVFRYPEEMGREMDRSQFIAAMQAEGIPCAPGYVPLYATNAVQSAMARNLAWAGRDAGDLEELCRPWPVTEQACYKEAVWLGQSTLLGSQADMDSIIQAAAKVLRLGPTA